MTAATAERLYAALEARHPGKVWRTIEVCPCAVVKTIDNEEDALVTLMNMERSDAMRASLVRTAQSPRERQDAHLAEWGK